MSTKKNNSLIIVLLEETDDSLCFRISKNEKSFRLFISKKTGAISFEMNEDDKSFWSGYEEFFDTIKKARFADVRDNAIERVCPKCDSKSKALERIAVL